MFSLSLYLAPLFTHVPGSKSLGPELVVLYITTSFLVLAIVLFLLRGLVKDGAVLEKSERAGSSQSYFVERRR
jgi:hypothetical protein